VILILVVLLQRGRGGGLSAAFGGGMAGGLLGSKTGDVLTWVTIAVVGVFLTLGVVLAKWYRPTATDFGQAQPVQQTQPAEGATSDDSGSSQPAAQQGGSEAAPDAGAGAEVNKPAG